MTLLKWQVHVTSYLPGLQKQSEMYVRAQIYVVWTCGIREYDLTIHRGLTISLSRIEYTNDLSYREFWLREALPTGYIYEDTHQGRTIVHVSRIQPHF